MFKLWFKKLLLNFRVEGLEPTSLPTWMTSSLQEHQEKLYWLWRILLEKTIAKGFTLARSKCKIAVKSIEALGHILSSQGISPALHSKEKLSLKDWNQECQDALEDLQDSPIPLPLSPFVFGLKTYLTTDASPTALAYAITQQGLDGTERIVEFRSREALALTWALVTAQHYLQYHPFT